MIMIKRLFSALLGREAPDFKVKALLPNSSLGWIERKDFKNKYWILMFYPLDLYSYSSYFATNS